MVEIIVGVHAVQLVSEVMGVEHFKINIQQTKLAMKMSFLKLPRYNTASVRSGSEGCDVFESSGIQVG